MVETCIYAPLEESCGHFAADGIRQLLYMQDNSYHASGSWAHGSLGIPPIDSIFKIENRIY